nr:MAG TPA: hypothetical protein [Caudoviricetes sp.]
MLVPHFQSIFLFLRCNRHFGVHRYSKQAQ